MRVGVNTRLLLAGKMDGIGWFATETLRRIVTAHPEHEFFFFFDRKYDEQFRFAPNVSPMMLRPPARHPVLWYLFFEWSVAWAIKKYKIDVFLSPESYISLRAQVPTLSVVHDINFEHAKDYLRPSHQRYMEYYSPRFAKKSTRIATVSEFSKHDISTTYGLDPRKIDVIYNGVNEGYGPISDDEKARTRSRYTRGCPYFIFVGTILKRKNLATLLRAFDKFKLATESDAKLVVAGNRVWWQDELAEAYENMRFREDVVILGRIGQDELFKLLASSISLVYPSLYEGFGIPILEGFKSEVPVITSNCTSMPEVAGDAALLIDPLDVDMMADCLTRVAVDSALRADLVAKGREQCRKFSWDRTAEQLWKSLIKTVEEGGVQ